MCIAQLPLSSIASAAFWGLYSSWASWMYTYGRTRGAIAIAVSITVLTPTIRILVFEGLFAHVPYLTRRKKSWDIYKPNPWCLYVPLFIGPYIYWYVDSLRGVSPWEACFASLVFVVVDCWFWVTHRLMHTRILYERLGHKRHHTLHAPTAFDAVENFTVADGLTHYLAFHMGFETVRLFTRLFGITLSQQLWALSLSQWVIVGQLQHGGKNIWIDSIPGVEWLRILTGFGQSLCNVHDLHHGLVSYNYSLTGFADVVAGTYVERRTPYIPPMPYRGKPKPEVVS
jgi:sterol desaturase/sphingolipid hydroxylase (fatty acid hydroxylase superfamily)